MKNQFTDLFESMNFTEYFKSFSPDYKAILDVYKKNYDATMTCLEDMMSSTTATIQSNNQSLKHISENLQAMVQNPKMTQQERIATIETIIEETAKQNQSWLDNSNTLQQKALENLNSQSKTFLESIKNSTAKTEETVAAQ